MKTFLEICQMVAGLVVVFLVLSQNGKDEGNVLAGTSNKGGTMGASREENIAKITKIVGIIYVILTIAAGAVMIVNR